MNIIKSVRAAKNSDFQSDFAISFLTIHLYIFKNKILWCFDFILALKSAFKLCYEKFPPALPGGKKPTWILSFPHIYLPLSWMVVCSICTAQLSSGCPHLMRMDEDVKQRGLHCTDCPPQAAESPVCTPRLTQQLQGEHKHILCFGSEKQWFQLQIKQKQKTSWESPITYYIPLNYILSTKEINRSRKDNEKKSCCCSSKVFIVPRFLWFPLSLSVMYSESTELLPSGARVPNRQANPAGSELVATITASCSGTGMDIRAGSKLKSKLKGSGRLMQLCPHGHVHLNHLELPWALC